MARRLKPEPGEAFRARGQYARYPAFATATDELQPEASDASIKPATGARDLDRTVGQGQQRAGRVPCRRWQECEEGRRRQHSRSGAAGTAQAIWLLVREGGDDDLETSGNCGFADRGFRRRILRLRQLASPGGGNNQYRNTGFRLRGRLWHGNGRAGTMGQSAPAAAASVTRVVQLRGAVREGGPDSRPPGRRRGAQRAAGTRVQQPATAARPRSG